jgi:hypothetical protein
MDFGFYSIKNALSVALKQLPDFSELNPFQIGNIIDKSFKSILKDLMNQFGLQPGIDYEDNLKDNEPGTDFVALSKKGDDLIRGLLEGKIVAIKAHTRVSKNGTPHIVNAHFRDLRKSA